MATRETEFRVVSLLPQDQSIFLYTYGFIVMFHFNGHILSYLHFYLLCHRFVATILLFSVNSVLAD